MYVRKHLETDWIGFAEMTIDSRGDQAVSFKGMKMMRRQQCMRFVLYNIRYATGTVSYTHLDVYKRQVFGHNTGLLFET